jgi:serine protease Do
MTNDRIKGFLIGLAISVVVLVSATGGALADRLFGIKPLDYLTKRVGVSSTVGAVQQKVLTEESVVIDVADLVSPSVVTVSIQTPQRRIVQFNPFGGGFSSRIEGGQPQDIGTGFIVSADGLVVTNKHVVSDTTSTYKVITYDGKEYEVSKISRDPSNDIAVLKIDASGLKSVEMGTSDGLKVGQFVIAIGTALGEFRHTVTTGVISGLGRGITAGSAYEGFIERLDDVIQTDAAINPGNSGGPLLNSAGQVIGINVAVAQAAQNIAFSIPINVVKSALETYNSTGSFASKPFLGVEYQMIDQETSILSKVPQGAYVARVVDGSSAANAGIQEGDIITKFDGQDVNSENNLADLIAKKKAGDSVKIETWRDGKTSEVSATLSESNQ